MGTSCLFTIVTCLEGFFPHETGLLCGSCQPGDNCCHYWETGMVPRALSVLYHSVLTTPILQVEMGEAFSYPQSPTGGLTALFAPATVPFCGNQYWRDKAHPVLFTGQQVAWGWTKPARKYLPSENGGMNLSWGFMFFLCVGVPISVEVTIYLSVCLHTDPFPAWCVKRPQKQRGVFVFEE